LFNGCQIGKYLVCGNADTAVTRKSNGYQIKAAILYALMGEKN